MTPSPYPEPRPLSMAQRYGQTTTTITLTTTGKNTEINWGGDLSAKEVHEILIAAARKMEDGEYGEYGVPRTLTTMLAKPPTLITDRPVPDLTKPRSRW